MTSRTTLTRYPDSFFVVLLSDRFESAKDDQGNYLIDRDGELFRHILNFMRNEKLTLPEGFNEFSLLECETDFFQLSTMKHQLQMYSITSENIGLNVGGKIYQTRRETLTREPDSYFTALLSGESPHARDAQGNFLIDRDGKLFRHVLNYLRSFYLQPLENEVLLTSLQNEAEYFGLNILREHIISVRELNKKQSQNIDSYENMMGIYYVLRAHLYYYEGGTCTVYTTGGSPLPADETSLLPVSKDDFHTICGSVWAVSFTLDKARAGSTVLDKLDGGMTAMYKYPANKENLLSYMQGRLNMAVASVDREIAANCSKIELSIPDSTF